MGRKKTYVGTQVSRVIEDDKLPNAVKTGVERALFAGEDMAAHVLDEMVNGLGVRAERLYEFAKNGYYVHGLPTGQFWVPGEELRTNTQTILNALEGQPVELEYVNPGPPNSLHIGWIKLVTQHGYNPVTNQLATLSAAKGKPVYLHDMVLVIPQGLVDEIEPGSLQQWGVPPNAGTTPERLPLPVSLQRTMQHTQVQVSTTGVGEYLRVEYVWDDPLLGLQQDSFTIPVTGYNDEADYVHACYTVPVAGSEPTTLRKFWMYELSSGGQPSLDALYDVEASGAGRFFPFVYFRFNKTSEGEDPQSEAYKDGKRMADYLGMDYDGVLDGIHENPDIEDVEQAMVMFAVPANTQNPEERAYLFEFFKKMFLAQSPDQRFQTEAHADVAASQLFGSRYQPPGIVIQDNRFKLSLSNRGIYKTFKPGSIGEVGSYDSGFSTFNVEVPLEWANEETGGAVQTVKRKVTYHYFRYQTTHELYEEIQVVDLQTRFHIWGKYGTVGDETDAILLVPIDRTITQHYSLPKRETLYARSLHYVFNSRIVVKLKWYQTGIFKAIMVIVSIVIAVLSWGTTIGPILAALNAGAFALALQLMWNTFLRYIIFKVGVRLFTEVVGAKMAFIVGLFAAAFGIYSEMGGLEGMPWAKELLGASSSLISEASAEMMKDVQQETQAFNAFAEQQWKLLDSAQDLLDNKLSTVPLVIFGESPDDFYNRTIHSGNIGALSIEAVTSFVDSRLMLPTIDQTLEFATT